MRLYRCPSTNCYESLAIVYIFFAVTNIFAPAVVSVLGPTVSMFVGGSTYLSVPQLDERVRRGILLF